MRVLSPYAILCVALAVIQISLELCVIAGSCVALVWSLVCSDGGVLSGVI